MLGYVYVKLSDFLMNLLAEPKALVEVGSLSLFGETEKPCDTSLVIIAILRLWVYRLSLYFGVTFPILGIFLELSITSNKC